MKARLLLWPLGLVAVASVGASVASAESRSDTVEDVPHYDHIFVIVEENKSYRQIMDHPELTPVMHRLISEYGTAINFYGEVHPSEGNYVAMLSGDTFGIHDDDAFYCRKGTVDRFCEGSSEANYPDHSVTAPSLMDQLTAKGLTWKGYMEDIPSAGSLAPAWPTLDYPKAGAPYGLYAAKHNGFVNFASVNRMPFAELERHIVGFAQLDRDLAADTMPNYAHIVPNQCNEMHGRTPGADGPDVPADCDGKNLPSLIQRGDREIGALVDKIMASKLWGAPGNTAIVVTFDEDNNPKAKSGTQGCCGGDPASPANFGGGAILTIVVTNHGPRHVTDPTPYNHYSLLRTTEAAFGLVPFLGHAADSDRGVKTMSPLFSTKN